MAAALAGTMRYCINKAVSLYHIVLLLVACVNFLPTICSSMLLGDSFVNPLTTRLKKNVKLCGRINLCSFFNYKHVYNLRCSFTNFTYLYEQYTIFKVNNSDVLLIKYLKMFFDFVDI